MLRLTAPARADATLLYKPPRTPLFDLPLSPERTCGECRCFKPLNVERPVAGRCIPAHRPGIVGRSVPACFAFAE